MYFDASSLVKHYIREAGSAEVTQTLQTRAVRFTSELTWLEVFSAFQRRLREGNLSARGFALAETEFLDDWPSWTVVPVTTDVLHLARTMLQRHALRAGDAIQLASALRVLSPSPITFWSADRKLRDAAAREGLRLT